jgi:hypothetical protein
MSDHALAADETMEVSAADLTAGRAEMLRRFRSGVRREVATHLSTGHPVFSCGLGDETGHLFMRLPDGRRLEYRVAADGTREIVHDATER